MGTQTKKYTFLGHLEELRSRMVKCAFAVVFTTILSFVFADRIFKVLTTPIQGHQLIFIELTEMIGIYMKVCLTVGVILAIPYIIYHFLAFVTPALSSKEKKYVYIVLPWVTLMFFGGVAFAFFVLIPPALNFLLGFGSDIATAQIRVGNYIDLVTRLMLAVGGVFELPVITTFLARVGIINYRWLASKRKFAVIVAFILGAIITPTLDPVNQTLIAGPLIVLYELSIWLARIFQKKKAREPSINALPQAR